MKNTNEKKTNAYPQSHAADDLSRAGGDTCENEEPACIVSTADVYAPPEYFEDGDQKGMIETSMLAVYAPPEYFERDAWKDSDESIACAPPEYFERDARNRPAETPLTDMAVVYAPPEFFYGKTISEESRASVKHTASAAKDPAGESGQSSCYPASGQEEDLSGSSKAARGGSRLHHPASSEGEASCAGGHRDNPFAEPKKEEKQRKQAGNAGAEKKKRSRSSIFDRIFRRRKG